MSKYVFHANSPPYLRMGECSICGKHTLLKVSDLPCGIHVGDCCFESLRTAHRAFVHFTNARFLNE